MDDRDRKLFGYKPLSEHLKSTGIEISHSTLQKYGCLGIGPEPIGHWGKLPIFTPRTADDWVDKRLKAPRKRRKRRTTTQPESTETTAT